MGELIDYYVILSTVEYDNDPLKFGRIKCNIPGVIHTTTTPEEAMPWVRPFVMNSYQSFSRPMVGQKIWVLISKTNYNEYWWYPFHETSDLVQDYLNQYYDNQPDVFNARTTGCGNIMFTFDEEQGYVMKIGSDFVKFGTDKSFKVSVNDCRIMIEGNKQYCGAGDSHDEYEPCVMGNKCKEMRNQMAMAFNALGQAAESSPYTTHLYPSISQLSKAIKTDILGTNHFVN